MDETMLDCQRDGFACLGVEICALELGQVSACRVSDRFHNQIGTQETATATATATVTLSATAGLVSSTIG
jgi:hypothetical protein